MTITIGAPARDPLLGDLVGAVLRLVVPAQEASREVAAVGLVDDPAARVAEDVDRRDVDDPRDASRPRRRRGRASSSRRWRPTSRRARSAGCRPGSCRRRGSRRPPRRIARSIRSTSERSSSTTSTPISRSAAARFGSRTSATTSSPRSRSARATARRRTRRRRSGRSASAGASRQAAVPAGRSPSAIVALSRTVAVGLPAGARDTTADSSGQLADDLRAERFGSEAGRQRVAGQRRLRAGRSLPPLQVSGLSTVNSGPGRSRQRNATVLSRGQGATVKVMLRPWNDGLTEVATVRQRRLDRRRQPARTTRP